MQIKFTCTDPLVEKHFPVVPAKRMLPEWYKDLEPNRTPGRCPAGYEGLPTAKKCMPALDMMSMGYIVPNAYEQEFTTSINEEGYEEYQRDINFRSGMDPNNGHHHEQCPVEIDGKKKNYFKIELPWKLETPPGYSSMIVPPFYHFPKGYSILPAVIDSDTYDAAYFNFVGVLLDEKVTISAGEPLAQIIPFKREEWKLQRSVDTSISENSALKFLLHNVYKRFFHSKKKFD